MLLKHFKASYLKKNIKNNRYIHILNNNSNINNLITPSCLRFIEELNDSCKFDYHNCLKLREKNFKEKNYKFRKDTKFIRDSEWKIDIPKQLSKRHVELTGPGDNKKMIINALNSKADAYMLDLEDSMTPSWSNIIEAHANIFSAVRGNLEDYKIDHNNNIIKKYNINNNNVPIFFLRSRGLHMKENNIIDENEEAISATIFDIGVHLFNNGNYLNHNNKGPYFYIPKLESYEESLFISKLLTKAEEILGLPKGTTKVTVLIETYPAIFQTEEIIYGLKNHIIGLNCGRWDYIFSMIKCLNKDLVLPDKDTLTMDKPFLDAYVKQIVQSCHKRGIHAMGGMSAFIPSNDEKINNVIIEKVNQDKNLEIERGCDGAWVAHPSLINPVKKIFEDKIGANNQIHNKFISSKITKKMLNNIGNNPSYNLDVFQSNINTSLQYISAWLSGNGAVALNGLMEDLATAEISVHQIKQWYQASLFNLNEELFDKLLEQEYQKILKNNQVSYSSKYFEWSKYILKEYVMNDYKFLPEVANQFIKYNKGFKGIEFDEKILDKLRGSKQLSGKELTKYRGNFLNDLLYKQNKSYKFLGTSNGVSAVNVVSGGNGTVGPYAGGWQTNAMKNRLGMLLPDTLHVTPEEPAKCAEEINNHLERADQIQYINKINNNLDENVNYYDIALLADMEQGWNTPEKIRISVKKAIENGINVIHIEDQGEKKRCGHLGDKELNTYEDYSLILRSANLAAQEILGKEQAVKQWVRFVARTDAYSAKRIVNSSNLYDKKNDEYKFIDWERGPSEDGKYLYLKEGINPETGKTWGMEISIQRCSKIVDEGLASHVWMETPDADLQVAHDFLEGVNNVLLPKGKKAYGLYNHSPSFDWDVKFFSEAEPLALKISEEIKKQLFDLIGNEPIEEVLNNIDLSKIQKIINCLGEEIKGDYNFTDENLYKILLNAYDHYTGSEAWSNKLNDLINENKLSNHHHDIIKYTNDTKNQGFRPIENISEIIVEQRLCNFSDMLTLFGFNMHLITLPEFHITAYNMHKLSKNFSINGINSFVKFTQRPERITSEEDPTYTYYKHQTATGTGVEALFSEAVGSSNVNILSESTEFDDIKARKQIK